MWTEVSPPPSHSHPLASSPPFPNVELISLDSLCCTSGVGSLSLWDFLSGFEALWGWHCVGPASHQCSPIPCTPSSPRGLHGILPIRSGHLNCVVNTRVSLCICVYNLAGQSGGCGILKCATDLTGSSPFQAAESAPGKDDAFWSCELVAGVELVWEAELTEWEAPGGPLFFTTASFYVIHSPYK